MTFAPADGRGARWRIIYDEVLSGLKAGDLVSYTKVADVLGLDAEHDKSKIRPALQRARLEFLEADKHALVSVPGVGYRVAAAGQHLELARRHHDRAGRALEVSHSLVANVNLSEITDPDVRKLTQLTVMGIAAQMDFNRRLGLRNERLEKNLSTVIAQTAHTASDVEDIKHRLARLEASS